MPRSKTRTLTELELQIMGVVWQREELTVEDVRDALEKQGRRLAFPSVRTMLGILQTKGYVTRRAVGRAHAYRASISRDKARRSILRDIVQRAFNGSASSLVAALLGGSVTSKKEMEKIRDLIRDHDKGEEP